MSDCTGNLGGYMWSGMPARYETWYTCRGSWCGCTEAGTSLAMRVARREKKSLWDSGASDACLTLKNVMLRGNFFFTAARHEILYLCERSSDGVCVCCSVDAARAYRYSSG